MDGAAAGAPRPGAGFTKTTGTGGPPSGWPGGRGPFGLRAHVVALVAAALLPAFAVSAVAVHEAMSSYRAAFDRRLRDTARTLAIAVDREIEAHMAALTALAASPRLDAAAEDGALSDLGGFYDHARGAAEAIGTPVVVIGTDLRQRLHTERPFGSPLPETNVPGVVRRVIETGRPAVSDVVVGAVLGRHVVSVAVPVLRGGRAVAVLSAPVSPDRLVRLLASQHLGGEGFSTIVDGNNVFVARSRRAAEFVGRPAPGWYGQLVAGRPSGRVEGIGVTGEAVRGEFQRLEAAPDWVVSVGEPASAHAASRIRPVATLVFGGAATLLLALAGTAWLGARILRPVRALERQAEALAAEGARAPPPETAPARVAEFEALRRSMLRADAALRDREARQALLVREVDHRAKNVLAVVQSVLRLTPKDEPGAFAAVEARVAALARVHSLLAEGGWSGADLRAVAERELAPYAAAPRRRGAPARGPLVSLDGPAVPLAPAAAQPFAMVLHELATNAAKHGALSAPGGAVEVRWRAGGGGAGRDGLLLLRWAEAGGPPVPGVPARRGFGTRVVEATVRGQLGGTVERRWERTGLVVEVAVPLARGAAADARAADARAGDAAAASAA